MALERIGRQPHGSTTDEDMMGHPPADNPEALFKAHDAELEASVARAELRNAKALAEKLQTLLDSKTHQVAALHAELESTRHARESAVAARDRWQARCEDADSTIDAVMKVLRPCAAPAFSELSPIDVARNIVARLEGLDPDMDTVPLADLLEAVGTFLEHDQALTIRGSFEAIREVDIHAMGLTFRVDTYEASEALTNAHALGQRLVVEVAQ